MILTVEQTLLISRPRNQEPVSNRCPVEFIVFSLFILGRVWRNGFFNGAFFWPGFLAHQIKIEPEKKDKQLGVPRSTGYTLRYIQSLNVTE